MKLNYLAFDTSGRQVADTIEATDAKEATETLRRRGLFVTKVASADAGSWADAGQPRRRTSGRRLKNLAMMLRQLHALVSCGTPLVPALGALERQAKEGPWRNVIVDVRTHVEEGASLAAAMDSRPEYFDAVCRSLVAAGESAGMLPAMLDRLAVMTRKQVHLRHAVLGAMVYPGLLLTVAVAVFILLLGLVIPRFGELFASLHVPLPPTTEVLIRLSHGLRTYWWAALAGTAGLGVAVTLWVRSPAGARGIDTVLLRLPKVGQIVRSFATARIARLLGVLLDARVDVLDALSLTHESTTNHHYTALIAKAREAVTQGESISSALRDTDLVSPSVYEAIRSGEQSGQVGPMLLNIADFLDEENEVVVRSLTSILEPAILVVMGVLVGLVAVSMFVPLFDLTAMTQGGG